MKSAPNILHQWVAIPAGADYFGFVIMFSHFWIRQELFMLMLKCTSRDQARQPLFVFSLIPEL